MSEIEAYLTANAEYEKAKSALAEAAEILRRVSEMLKHQPERFHFSNAGGEGLPMEIVLNSSNKSFDAHHWPSPERIHSLIMQRFTARRAVEAAWQAVPSSMRVSLVPPKL